MAKRAELALDKSSTSSSTLKGPEKKLQQEKPKQPSINDQHQEKQQIESLKKDIESKLSISPQEANQQINEKQESQSQQSNQEELILLPIIVTSNLPNHQSLDQQQQQYSQFSNRPPPVVQFNQAAEHHQHQHNISSAQRNHHYQHQLTAPSSSQPADSSPIWAPQSGAALRADQVAVDWICWELVSARSGQLLASGSHHVANEPRELKLALDKLQAQLGRVHSDWRARFLPLTCGPLSLRQHLLPAAFRSKVRLERNFYRYCDLLKEIWFVNQTNQAPTSVACVSSGNQSCQLNNMTNSRHINKHQQLNFQPQAHSLHHQVQQQSLSYCHVVSGRQAPPPLASVAIISTHQLTAAHPLCLCPGFDPTGACYYAAAPPPPPPFHDHALVQPAIQLQLTQVDGSLPIKPHETQSQLHQDSSSLSSSPSSSSVASSSSDAQQDNNLNSPINKDPGSNKNQDLEQEEETSTEGMDSGLELNSGSSPESVELSGSDCAGSRRSLILPDGLAHELSYMRVLVDYLLSAGKSPKSLRI